MEEETTACYEAQERRWRYTKNYDSCLRRRRGEGCPGTPIHQRFTAHKKPNHLCTFIVVPPQNLPAADLLIDDEYIWCFRWTPSLAICRITSTNNHSFAVSPLVDVSNYAFELRQSSIIGNPHTSLSLISSLHIWFSSVNHAHTYYVLVMGSFPTAESWQEINMMTQFLLLIMGWLALRNTNAWLFHDYQPSFTSPRLRWLKVRILLDYIMVLLFPTSPAICENTKGGIHLAKIRDNYSWLILEFWATCCRYRSQSLWIASKLL